MVDFKKCLGRTVLEKPLAPEDIYDRLDRASDKGPLRPAQKTVLDTWHNAQRKDRDVIVKMHTGQGKTLVGLLMLQAKMNEQQGRALYLCPNHYLVRQTLRQARQFGIKCLGVTEEGELPVEFSNAEAILVVPVQKLFNGLTKFGLCQKSVLVNWVVMDDCHACIDAIKDACTITVPKEHPAYQKIVALFEDDLQYQGAGRFAELKHFREGHGPGPLLPIPYWAWQDHHLDVVDILAGCRNSIEICFTWPLLRDRVAHCLCLVSGSKLVITPYAPPLEDFGTYSNAKHRIFMSATVSDDSFLIKGFGLTEAVIAAPLTDPSEKWSGEKMILLPSLIDESLSREEVTSLLARKDGRKFGVVVLTPSFDSSHGWEKSGAIVAKSTDEIERHIETLRNGQGSQAVVVVNRYDGIDLPDDTCRILVIDGRPRGESLMERYSEECRPNSHTTSARIARIIEQGLGRAVRGEKDYRGMHLTQPPTTCSICAWQSIPEQSWSLSNVFRRASLLSIPV